MIVNSVHRKGIKAMVCQQCHAELPAKAQVCFFCGETVSFQTTQKKHQQKSEKVYLPTLHPSQRFFGEISSSTYDIAESEIQGHVARLIANAQRGSVTYETVFRALMTDCNCPNHFINELDMYYAAYDTWTEYSDLLSEVSTNEIILAQFNLLCRGAVQNALESIGCDSILTTQVLSYPGLKRWLAESIITMLLMEIFKAGILVKIPPAEHWFGYDLCREQVLLALNANHYRVAQNTNQEAIESFIRSRNREVLGELKEQLRQMVLKRIAIGLLHDQIRLPDASVIICLLANRLDSITKEYELILFVALLRITWYKLDDIQIA